MNTKRRKRSGLRSWRKKTRSITDRADAGVQKALVPEQPPASDGVQPAASLPGTVEPEQQYHAMFEKNRVISLLIDPATGAIVDANSAATQYYGYTKAQLLSMRVSTINTLSEEQIKVAMSQAVRAQTPYFNFRHRLANGVVRDVEVYSNPIDVGGRRLLHSIVHDITERKHMEDALRQSEANQRALLNAADETIFLMERDCTIITMNELTATRLRATVAQMQGCSIYDFLPPENIELRRAMINQVLVSGQPISFEDVRLGRNIDSRIYPVLDEQGYVVRLAVFARDITETKRIAAAERYQHSMTEALRDTALALTSSLELDDILDRILDNVGRVVPHDAVNIMLVDPNGETTTIVRSQGYSERGAGGVINFRFVLSGVPILKQMVRDGKPVTIPDTTASELWVRRSESDWVNSYIGAPIRIRGETVGFLNLDSATPGFFNDRHAEQMLAFADQAAIAIQNARMYTKLQELAITDPVTGAFNRRGLTQLGDREVDRSIRFAHPLTAVMLDIDHFKRVNDTYGHLTGDRVLRALARCCRDSVRNVDIVARYGGEEFVLLLSETDVSMGATVAERLRSAVEELYVEADTPGDMPGKGVRITASLGVAALTQDMTNLSELIASADHALYVAKQTGRNRISVFERP